MPVNGWPEPVTLTGPHATLVPLAPDHHDGLVEAVRDGELWRLWYTTVPSPEGMATEIQRRLAWLPPARCAPSRCSTPRPQAAAARPA
jgi:hypothetical protein